MRNLVLAVALVALLPRPGHAQSPDFLFGRPNGNVAVRSGWVFARAGSDLFSFVQDQLTLERRDFNAPAIGVDLDLSVAPRVDIVTGFDFSGSSTRSEYRDLLDNLRLPINQTTRLREMNLSGSLKVALTPRWREISSHAWIPSAVTPYVGAGGGALWYEFHQTGDFVDFVDLSVFPNTFRSSGWAPGAHVFGGVDLKASRRIYFSAEARYLWSHATLGEEFSGFDPIDLTGFRLTGGIRYTF